MMCREFVITISEVLLAELKTTLSQTKYFSILTYGSTDAGIVEKELVYILYIAPSGCLECKLFRLKNCTDGSAVGLKKIIESCFEELGITNFREKLVGLGADGAAVNMGCKKGLAVLLRQDGSPWLISNHCFNHRLELAMKNAFDKTYMDEVSEILMSLYYFYRNSPKRLAHLRAVALALNSKASKPLKCHGTRWVQHKLNACQALLKSYTAIITHLEDMASDSKQDQAKAKGILKKVQSTKFVLHLLYFVKLLEPVCRVSLAWQADSTDMPTALGALHNLQGFIESLKVDNLSVVEPGSDLDSLLKDCELSKAGQLPLGLVFHDVTLTDAVTGERFFSNHCRGYVTALETCIQSRFEDVNEGMLADCGVILDTRLWPFFDNNDTNSLQNFGNEEIIKISKHFSELLLKSVHIDNVINPTDPSCSTSSSSPVPEANEVITIIADTDTLSPSTSQTDSMPSHDSNTNYEMDVFLNTLLNEWKEFKYIVKNNMKETMKQPPNLWLRLHTMYDEKYPKLNALITIIRVIPMSNAIVERCFSAMNKTKTDWRCSLNESTLEALLRIKKEGPGISVYQSDKAVQVFFSTPRRFVSSAQKEIENQIETGAKKQRKT